MVDKKKAMTFASVLKNQIYKNRDAIYALVPTGGLLHRVEQKNQLVMELAPILMKSSVPAVFLYGMPGTGKTSLVTELSNELGSEAENNSVDLKTVYVNCSENRTETTILIAILAELSPEKNFPKLGWTRAKAVDEFTKTLDKFNTNILVVLDEVDYALKESGDDILYRLSRINDKVKSKVSSILISNDVRVASYIKPKTQSALGRVTVIFAPYTVEELTDILKERAKNAFLADTVSDVVLKKMAEIEAHRGGDARKALELLDACAKIAVAKGRNKITIDLVDEADTTLEKDTVLSRISTLTKHQKLLFLALLQEKSKDIDGGTLYEKYIETCEKQNVAPLSVRSIRTFLIHFSEMGMIESEVTWLRDLNKKARKIHLQMDNATKVKARKLIRDTL